MTRNHLKRIGKSFGWGTLASLAVYAFTSGSIELGERPLSAAGVIRIRPLTSGRGPAEPQTARAAPSAKSTARKQGKPAAVKHASVAKAAAPASKRAASRARQKRRSRPTREPAVAYRKVVAAGVPLHIVQIDPRRPEVRIAVATAANGIGCRDTWPGMIRRTRPVAAITGTYYGTRSMIPVGTIVVGGRSIHRGLVGTAFTFTRGKGAQLVACRGGAGYTWSRAETVLRAGPRLLTGGKRTLWPRGEGFRDPAIFGLKKRTAVAITRHGKLLLVAVEKPVLLRTLAGALQRLGAVDAMCLDGGSSAGLYCKGKSWVVPRRAMTNLLVVYDSAARYRQHTARLNPRGPRLVHGAPALKG